MSGGVRNLRAMFENKEESTMPPPDRGRSPAGSIGGGSNGTSPRPLSKVRTSFVAVERSGQLGPQWGIRKESSNDPSSAIRRASSSIDEENDPKFVAERNHSINSEVSAKNNSTAISETIPEFAIETPPLELEKRSGYINGNSGRVKVTSSESLPITKQSQKPPAEEHHTKIAPGEVKNKETTSGRTLAVLNKNGISDDSNINGTGKPKPSSQTKTVPGTGLSSRTARPGPISTAPSLGSAKPPTKSTVSPSHPKTPTTPAKSTKGTTPKPAASSSTKAQLNSTDMKATGSTANSNSNLRLASRPTASLTATSKLENKAPLSSPPTGFHKPKPKSPTRPANLPASMTAPTTSSLSKVTSATPTGRPSLTLVDKTVSRSRSHASLAQKRDLQHRPSRLENDRPALGRPPTSTLKKQQSRPSLPKQPIPVEESFLARMMRPTTSSASKTTEKAVTPPRAKTHTRPTTREGLPSHKLHHELKGSPSTKRLPTVANETSTEELCAISVAESEEALESIRGTAEPEPTSTEKEDILAPVGLTNGDSLAPIDDNEPIHKDLVQESTDVIPSSEVDTGEPVDAVQHVELLRNHNDSNIDAEISPSIEEIKAEEVSASKEDHSPAVKASDATIINEEPLKIEIQGAPEMTRDIEKEYLPAGVSELHEVEHETTDTVVVD